MISSKARTTLLAPIRMAEVIAKTLLINKVPFLQDSRARRAGVPSRCLDTPSPVFQVVPYRGAMPEKDWKLGLCPGLFPFIYVL